MDEDRCEGAESSDPADPSVDRLSDDDQGILLCAVRYCIGRMSYIVGSCDLWLRERWPRLSTGIQKTILRDIHEALERHRLGHGSIGMEMDERIWAALYRDLSPPTGPVDLGERPNTESSPTTAAATQWQATLEAEKAAILDFVVDGKIGDDPTLQQHERAMAALTFACKTMRGFVGGAYAERECTHSVAQNEDCPDCIDAYFMEALDHIRDLTGAALDGAANTAGDAVTTEEER